MAVTAKEIKDCLPEFAGFSDLVVDKFRLQAERRVNLAQWAGKADDAILYLTGHLLKLFKSFTSGATAASGPISQKRVGDLAVSYKVPEKMSNTWLARTTYGQMYIELKQGVWPTRVLA